MPSIHLEKTAYFGNQALQNRPFHYCMYQKFNLHGAIAKCRKTYTNVIARAANRKIMFQNNL